MNQDVLEAMAEALHANRDRLIDPALQDLPDGSGLETQRRLVQLGIRPGRLAEVAGPLGDENADVAFERALRDARGEVRILVSAALYREIAEPRTAPGESPDREPQTLDGLLRYLNDGLFAELGAVFAGPAVEVHPELGDRGFRIQINDVRLPRRPCLLDDEFLVNTAPETLERVAEDARPAVNPATKQPAAIVRGRTAAAMCEALGYTVWNQPGSIVLETADAIRRHAAWLMNTDVADFCITQFGKAFPRLTSAATSRYDLPELTRVLRCLLEEEISIHNLFHILNHLVLDEIEPPVVLAGQSKAPQWLVLAESVRGSLRRYISKKYALQSNTLVVYLIDPGIESRLADPEELSYPERSGLITAVASEIGHLPSSATPPVILTARHIRYRLRQEIAKEFPRMKVLSYQELEPDLIIQPVARITVVT